MATGERTPMSEERLAEIEADHVAGNHGRCGGCNFDVDWPCDAVELAAEVRELRRIVEML